MTTDIKEFNPQEVERLKRNLRETSMNEGSVDLACRCADSLIYIEQLEGQLSAAMSGWKQNVEELKTQLSAQTAEPVSDEKIIAALAAARIGWNDPDNPIDGQVIPFFNDGDCDEELAAVRAWIAYTHPPVIQTEQPSLSDADRETVLGVIAWLKGAAQGDRPNTSRGEAADALTRLLSAQRQDSDKDPMDWTLPCDVFVGHGTFKKGVKLRTLVARMKVLYEMATGKDADAIANGAPK